jgi:hypothetical protein
MSVVVIRVAGNDITDDVEITSAKFTTVVNGAIGTVALRIRDDDHSHDFATGDTVTLEVDGALVWSGFLTKASKTYPFDVEDTTNPTATPRYWALGGVDYNVLFNKRIIFDAAHPADHVSFHYAAGEWDDVIVNDLFDNYLDLSGDGLSRAGVTRVDRAILDIKGVSTRGGTVASAGFTWKQAMDVVARATGAVYYIDADKVVNYVDVDTADSDYTLTDQPSGPNDVGYQRFELLENGTGLINDMLVWGTAIGSDHVVFARAQDSTSMNEHTLMQAALVTSGLYKQASANLVAASVIDGTPASKRGAKNDQISFMCRVFEPLFRGGQKVTLENGIFGYSDVLPIRRLTVTFASPTEPYFDLILSHDIDQPVSLFETIFPHIPGIDGGGITLPPIRLPRIDECKCGQTDTFGRPDQTDGWGTADCGRAWHYFDEDGALNASMFSIQDGWGVLTSDGINLGGDPAIVMDVSLNSLPVAIDVTFQFELDLPGAQTEAEPQLLFVGPNSPFWGLDMFLDTVGSSGYVAVVGVDSPGTFIDPYVISANEIHNVHLQLLGAQISLKLWADGDDEPDDWLVQDGNPAIAMSDVPNVMYFFLPGFPDTVLKVRDLNVTDINACGGDFLDNFDTREQIGSWGALSSGLGLWFETHRSNPASSSSVSGGLGMFNFPSGAGDIVQTVPLAGTPIGRTWGPTDSGFEMMAAVDFRGPFFGNGTSKTIGFAIGDSIASFDLFLTLFLGSDGVSTFDIGARAGQAFANGATYVDRGFVKWLVNPGVSVKGKAWLASAAEPDWMVEADDTTDPLDLSTKNLFVTGENETMGVDWIRFDVGNCPDGNPPQPGSGGLGYICENADRVGSRLYQLTATFAAGSAEVYINNILCQKGVGYTELPSAGRIEFSSPMSVDGLDKVRVCYYGTGAV